MIVIESIEVGPKSPASALGSIEVGPKTLVSVLDLNGLGFVGDRGLDSMDLRVGAESRPPPRWTRAWALGTGALPLWT